MPHQSEFFAFIREHSGRACGFLAPGTGKTIVAIRSAQTGPPPYLIICRRDDYMTWLIELEAEGVQSDDILEIDSGDELPDDGPRSWTIVSYDLTKNETIAEYIRDTPWSMVIADESDYIKHFSSARTKTVIRTTRHIPRRLALTGSAITNCESDVFSQCLFVDDGATFGKEEWDFYNKYYLRGNPGWYIRKGSAALITERLKRIAYSVHEDDVLKLPPKRFIVKSAPMSPIQRKHYQRALDDWEIELATGETIEFNQVIVQLTKLRQIASGFFYRPDGTVESFKCPKVDLLLDLLKDPAALGRKSKVAVWCSHVAEIERIAAASRERKWPCVTFYGSDREAKELSRKRFRDDKRVRLFIGQSDSGRGMNELIVADSSVYFSNSFKVASRQQSERRTRRKGSEIHTRIDYWDLVTEGSVDKHILRGVRTRMDIATAMLAELRKGKSPSEILQ